MLRTTFDNGVAKTVCERCPSSIRNAVVLGNQQERQFAIGDWA